MNNKHRFHNIASSSLSLVFGVVGFGLVGFGIVETNGTLVMTVVDKTRESACMLLLSSSCDTSVGTATSVCMTDYT